MTERISKTQRWLDLISLLLGRRLPLSVEEIMENVPAYARGWRSGDRTAQASARRVFERDKDELREMGIPIETVGYSLDARPEPVEGYRITRRDFYLPYLRLLTDADGSRSSRPIPQLPEITLQEGEAGYAVEALRRAAEIPAFPFAADAGSALRKLSFDLDLDRFGPSPLLWAERPGTAEVLERLRVLSAALLARKRVRFGYAGIARGEATGREVSPYGLFLQRDWYLVGHDETRGAIRVFRVTRMQKPEPNRKAPKTPDYAVPDDFALADYLRREPWELGGEADEGITAEVRFTFPASLWAAQNEQGEPVEDAADGSSIRRFHVQQVDPFLRWVLSLAGEAEILAPPELRSALESMVDGVAALYGEGVHAGG